MGIGAIFETANSFFFWRKCVFKMATENSKSIKRPTNKCYHLEKKTCHPRSRKAYTA